jgi:hypothetical protein
MLSTCLSCSTSTDFRCVRIPIAGIYTAGLAVLGTLIYFVTRSVSFSLYVVLVRDILDLTPELPVTCTQDLITRSVSLLLYVALVRDILDMTPELPVTRIRTFLYQSEFSSSIISLTFISRYTYIVRIDTRSVSFLLYAF